MTLSKNFTDVLSSFFDENYVFHLIEILGEVVSDRRGRCVKSAINYLKHVMTHLDEYKDVNLYDLFYQTYYYVCTLYGIVPGPSKEDDN